jgi:type II secretion system protein G
MKNKLIKNWKLKIGNWQRGFTLIELLIVIAIIGVLATLLMVNFVGVRQRARDAQRKSDLRQIQSALEIWRSDNGSYPLTNALVPNGANCGTPLKYLTTTYMAKLPCDPSNVAPYVYYYFSSGGADYTLSACLENVADAQKDKANDPTHGCGTTSWSFTLNNP